MSAPEIRLTLKGACTVWYRDVMALLRDRTRFLGSLAMGMGVFLAMAFGLGGTVGRIGGGAGIPGVPYVQFALPAFMAMGVMMSALQSTVSVVWDREFGFMRKILVAPVSRTSIALGKVAGGITVALIPTPIVLLLAPFIGLRLAPLTFVAILVILMLEAAAMTALGILIAARQKSTQAFQFVQMFVMMPMTLLTFGSFLPTVGTGTFATVFRVVSQVNPAAYAIDALRQITLGSQLPAAMRLHAPAVDVVVLAVLFVLFLAPGVLLFSKQD